VLIKLGLDAEVDIATRDEMNTGLDDALKKNRAPRPMLISVIGSSTQLNTNAGAGGGNGVVTFGHPPAGKIWNILSVTLMGDDDTTTVAGKGALYVDSETQALGLANLRMPGLTIPSFTFITRQTLWAHSSGDVCLNLTGVGGTARVNGVLGIAEYHETDIGARTTR